MVEKCWKCGKENSKRRKCCVCGNYTCIECDNYGYCLTHKSCHNCMVANPEPNLKQQIAQLERNLDLHPPTWKSMRPYYAEDGRTLLSHEDPRDYKLGKLYEQLRESELGKEK